MTTSSRFLSLIAACLFCCSSSEEEVKVVEEPVEEDFYFGADLSYVNQIEDHGGVYKVGGTISDPYKIFKEQGTNLIRLRLWHNPQWTKEIYGSEGTQLYNDLKDVEKSISRAKAQGMKVLLDFHFSDTWADPAHQDIPSAWLNIKSVAVLADSVYNYTSRTLTYLNQRNLLPEFVQIGNETNCGMLYSNAPDGFPAMNVCNGNWSNFGKVINAGIKAVRHLTASATIKTKVVLHVADPKNVEWWFSNIKSQGGVIDFDVVGFSYYPLWHTTVPVSGISTKVKSFVDLYKKEVWIMETAYPWTTEAKDSYNNHFGNETAVAGFPKTLQGQYDMMVRLTEELKEGGGNAIIYWEPAWISSAMKDLWGTGSSWENSTLFDFDGNAHKGMDYMKQTY